MSDFEIEIGSRNYFSNRSAIFLFKSIRDFFMKIDH